MDQAGIDAMKAQIDAEVRTAVKAGEKVGTLGNSKPPVSEMFEGVFKEPDWRIAEQRRETGGLSMPIDDDDPGDSTRRLTSSWPTTPTSSSSAKMSAISAACFA